MNFRSRARAFLIQTAALARVDELALRLQKLKGSAHGLVVGVHETPASLEAHFREQLEWASQHFAITTLEGFAKLWDDPPASEANSKPPVLFTFDDGRESNYTVAAPLLESFGGRGVFFVVPAFAECAALANDSKQVLAIGVNCTPPQFVESLVQIAVSVSNKAVLAYPNKGEIWDAQNKCWLPGAVHTDFITEAIGWRNAGATLIGGCCRTSPEDIKQIRQAICA